MTNFFHCISIVVAGTVAVVVVGAAVLVQAIDRENCGHLKQKDEKQEIVLGVRAREETEEEEEEENGVPLRVKI